MERVFSRNKFMSSPVILIDILVLIGLFSSITLSWAKKEEKLLNVEKLKMFVDEFQDMPKIRAYDVVNGVPKHKSLHIGMFMKKWKFHRDIPPTPVFAYGKSRASASVPGPTIEALQGIETRVTWRNHLPRKHILPWDPTIPSARPESGGVPTVVHLHGGIDSPESDGNSNAWFTANFSEVGPTWSRRTYKYCNRQHPGNLWYHDHAMGLTRVNLLAGLLGAYVLRSPAAESRLRLPSGDDLDRVLVVFDRSFRSDGTIFMNSTGNNPHIHPQWQPEYFGDAVIVNGKAWPTLAVRRRKYRFRILNASNARFFRFRLADSGGGDSDGGDKKGLRFVHVGSDSAYLKRPATSRSVLLGPSEIADVVVDFSESKGKSVILTNDAEYPFPGGDPVSEATSKVMRFAVADGGGEEDASRVPRRLMEDYPDADVSSAAVTRYIAMYEYANPASGEPTHLYLNARPYEAEATERARVGSAEVWEVINLTEDNHPLHIHLALFAVLEQTELVGKEEFLACMTEHNDAVECHVGRHARGRRVAVAAHERGWKNVFKMMPGHVTKILLRFSYIHSNQSYPFDATAEPGYVYHCHILDHEDNAMMRPLKMVN